MASIMLNILTFHTAIIYLSRSRNKVQWFEIRMAKICFQCFQNLVLRTTKEENCPSITNVPFFLNSSYLYTQLVGEYFVRHENLVYSIFISSHNRFIKHEHKPVLQSDIVHIFYLMGEEQYVPKNF